MPVRPVGCKKIISSYTNLSEIWIQSVGLHAQLECLMYQILVNERPAPWPCQPKVSPVQQGSAVQKHSSSALPPLEMRPSSIAPTTAESREAPADPGYSKERRLGEGQGIETHTILQVYSRYKNHEMF